MEDFATVAEIQAGLEWTLSEEETNLCEGALASLSSDARYYGREWFDKSEAPHQVHNIVVKATRRFLRNPDGYTTSRAADETVTWPDRKAEAGEANFTEREIKMLEKLGGNTTRLVSVQLSAYGPRRNVQEGYVPVARDVGHEKPFPFFSQDDSPW
jgi:hypothetical protein